MSPRSESSSPSRVRVPVSRRLRQWRSRLLVVFCWGVCLAAALWLASGEKERVEVLGIVDAREWTVATVEPGRISSLAVDVLDRVESGQVLVTLDSTTHYAEMEVLKSELQVAKANLDAEATRLEMELSRDRQEDVMDHRRLLIDYETARLDHLERLVTTEVDKATAERIEAEVERQRAMAAKGAVGRAILEDLELRLAALQTKIRGEAELIAVSKVQLEEAQKRLDWESGEIPADEVLGPLQAEIDRQQARIRLLMAGERNLVLRSPLDGIVNRIDRRVGEAVLPGEPILSIADPSSSQILVYLDEELCGQLQPGDGAEIRSISGRGGRLKGTVVKVGGTVTERPIRFRRRFDIPEWGVPATVEVPEGISLLPGQRVRVSITPS
jgi:multidrug resistance efflux pump